MNKIETTSGIHSIDVENDTEDTIDCERVNT